ncbi:hypothetical protein MJO28_004609 [Puccinia striiformis f. sp. tritici]|uniref:Copper/zinc superoxide dismutase n=3 Tax=Puccinia striiformis TaxID=27350 RepID=A0A0L0V7W4_9BASI|nr:hypothetical protein Pst134EA_006790 [Puccinia striiformis f. sp. tritici]KAI9608889.1 hypothetical protein H4Q26_005080 [Puccinia striiformis f. sp. tritici PST-130]KNE95281.1 copper/zinc superoxide dismutase [Puccinia striiformis f. sp. tritici PST-78]POW20373.1 hypothetical protein PSHT_03627 [Puccinia striiformis]KAH9459722.1 hypothetical protein Pst134EB_007952 [Puccinia striiformis f. sp. tritici]KAH9469497.1 hypothetical protein Pst134EA_006790 [Puccinia striiformis f. sp. tritici]
MSKRELLLTVLVFAISLATRTLAAPPNEPYPESAQVKMEKGSLKASLEFYNVPKEDRKGELAQFTRQLTEVLVHYTAFLSGKEYTYSIHEKSVTNNDCSTVGEIWNPKNWNVKDPSYKCNPQLPSRCAAGDLSGQHGTLRGNGVGETSLPKYYDTSLPLTYSPQGILGKSVVVRDSSNQVVLCGNIVAGVK